MGPIQGKCVCVSSISINWDFHDPGPFETANTRHAEDVVDDIIPDFNVLLNLYLYRYNV